ncbi:MAG: hypothetical protein E7161_03530 [Firmicutes bacterium]|nr:hypothetical protein [Bacillota bacterium]
MFEVLLMLIPILAVCIIGFTIAMILSPKLRGKMMSSQIKAAKYMIEESEESIADIATPVGNIAVKSQKRL